MYRNGTFLLKIDFWIPAGVYPSEVWIPAYARMTKEGRDDSEAGLSSVQIKKKEIVLFSN